MKQRHFSFVSDFFDTQVMGDVLQFTFLVLQADKTVLGMVGYEQLHHGSSRSDGAKTVRLDFHPLVDWCRTGGRKISSSFHFHYTGSAGRHFVDHFDVMEVKMAKGRDIDIQCFRSLKNREILRNLDFFIVDGYIYHDFPSYTICTALIGFTGQAV